MEPKTWKPLSVLDSAQDAALAAAETLSRIATDSSQPAQPAAALSASASASASSSAGGVYDAFAVPHSKGAGNHILDRGAYRAQQGFMTNQFKSR